VLRATPNALAPAPPKVRTLIDFLALTLNPTIKHDWFWWSDPLPGILQALSTIAWSAKRAITKSSEKLNQYEEHRQLTWVRSRHHARLLQPRYFKTIPKQILFLCYGNICRSPFAAGYWNARTGRYLLGSQTAISAGLYPRSHRKTPGWLTALAAEHNVDLAGHQSCILTREHVESAEAIFVMDRLNYRGLLAGYPRARHKTYFLALFAGDERLEIDDPYLMSTADARACLAGLVRALDGLMDILRRE
jgi:protein-tyrosine phosphatase